MRTIQEFNSIQTDFFFSTNLQFSIPIEIWLEIAFALFLWTTFLDVEYVIFSQLLWTPLDRDFKQAFRVINKIPFNITVL